MASFPNRKVVFDLKKKAQTSDIVNTQRSSVCKLPEEERDETGTGGEIPNANRTVTDRYEPIQRQSLNT